MVRPRSLAFHRKLRADEGAEGGEELAGEVLNVLEKRAATIAAFRACPDGIRAKRENMYWELFLRGSASH